ncbi:hypothetical protein [Streptomyces curacoi]|uniref:Uncharacterized protein n=1 Tax=Streptomyces curacoi TaxID=146536 RepID=A0A124H5B6_9ACTN|nr:hypothetical protein [Streptomyces curacoi]KUM79156.1 hypothetical protein AQI70_09925 [Streptomyces curacoi]
MTARTRLSQAAVEERGETRRTAPYAHRTVAGHNAVVTGTASPTSARAAVHGLPVSVQTVEPEEPSL